MSEAAWNKAFTQGSRALQDRLKKVHASNPKFQAWMQKSGHGAGASVKQASKEVKPSARVKSLQTKSLQAYGATKGTKVGGEHGSGEMRDTIAPLTRDQHSKVQAAERAAKAAAKKAAPAKPKKPLSQAERMAAIAKAVKKAKSKDRFDVPTVNPDDVDHDDLRDVHQSLHVSRGYNEEVEQIKEGVATAQKVMDRANVVAKTNPDPKKRFAASGLAQKAMLRTINPTGVNTGITRGGGNKTYRMVTGKVPPYQLTKKTGVSEEVEQISEMDSEGYRGHRGDEDSGKGPAKYVKPVTAKKTQDDAAKVLAKSFEKDKIKKEEVIIEGAKEDAEKLLGGPVKTRTGSEPKGKLPLGFRRARNLARKAMKTVKESTTEVSEVNEMNHGKKLAKMIMAKQSQHPIAQNMGEENIVEQDDSMEKKEMAQTQLHFIKYAAEEILAFIDMGGEVEEWYQNKLSKVQSEVESLHSYIEGEKRRTGMVKEEEEQIDEKAPPGAKFERMVKHIKKGYAKGGLTPKEKSIAYATAWKAYGKKNEEVEQIDERNMENKAKKNAMATKLGVSTYVYGKGVGVNKYDHEPSFKADPAGFKKVGRSVMQSPKTTSSQVTALKKANEEVVTEAEGTVAVTPKEKALAAHHGDPKKITYGDVIKARLKSAAAKKMGNK